MNKRQWDLEHEIKRLIMKRDALDSERKELNDKIEDITVQISSLVNLLSTTGYRYES